MEPIHGRVAPGFEPVLREFERNFRDHLVDDPREKALRDAITRAIVESEVESALLTA